MVDESQAGKIHLFLGPSIPETDIPNFEGRVLHGPAAQGDVYRIIPSKPFAIGIIDGYFQHVPAVWHKEVLWALSSGVHVFGAGSMGALRALELEPWGMVGVGQIFEWFRDGIVEDDDEVAVTHGPVESGYRAASEAMVNVRATAEAARVQGVISKETEGAIIFTMKERYFPDRRWDEKLLQQLKAEEADSFRAWISDKNNRVDLKRRDAQLLVSRILELRANRPGAKQVDWAFARTDAWEQVRRNVAAPSNGELGAQERDEVLDEVRLNPEAYAQLRCRTNLRLARALFSQAEGLSPNKDQLRATLNQFMTSQGLTSEDEIRLWQNAQNINTAELEQLLKEQAQANCAEQFVASNPTRALLDTLKLEGTYAHWAAKAAARALPSEKN